VENASEIPMSNPTQPDVLDRMIARLEEANARSYKEPPRADETPSRSDHDEGHQSPNQPVASKRRSFWARPWFVAVVVLLIAAPAYLASSARESSYLDGMKLTFARWVNAAVLQTGSRTLPQDSAVPAPSIPPEIEQRLQGMADELADLHLRIGQIKTSQDQISASGAETVAQLKKDREQTMRDNANIVDQLKATQEQLKVTQAQLAEVVSSKSPSSSRKFFRRKRVSPLSLSPRTQSLVR
jgi:hypothetical protein